jgi:hypothetical protein
MDDKTKSAIKDILKSVESGKMDVESAEYIIESLVSKQKVPLHLQPISNGGCKY